MVIDVGRKGACAVGGSVGPLIVLVEHVDLVYRVSRSSLCFYFVLSYSQNMFLKHIDLLHDLIFSVFSALGSLLYLFF